MFKYYFSLFSVFFVILLSVLIHPVTVRAEEANITGVIITYSADDIIIYSSLKEAFSEQVEEMIENGLPVTFKFYLELNKKRSFWPDKNLEAKTINHTLTYDMLKKEYTFTSSDNGKNKSNVIKDYNEVKQCMCEINGVKIAPFSILEEADDNYYVKIKAKMETKKIIFPFNYLLFFVPSANFETAWKISPPLTISR